MRVRAVLLGLALFVLAAAIAGVCFLIASAPALAHVLPAGPHNENGNRTLDYYIADDFGDSISLVIRDINNTPVPLDMPLARRVKSLNRADVLVMRDPTLTTGGRFSHRKSGPDIIRIGILVTGAPTGERIYIHEFMHSYGMRHLTDEECSLADGGSVMCPARWNPHYLTLHDEEDLRSLPNQYQGSANRYTVK